MAERKHTPGPWVVLGDDLKEGDIPFIEVCAGQMPDPSYRLIAEVQCTDNESEDISKAFVLTDENWANAHLIAAAPSMFEALEAAIECGLIPTSTAKDGGPSARSEQVRVADLIRAALSRAKGDT